MVLITAVQPIAFVESSAHRLRLMAVCGTSLTNMQGLFSWVRVLAGALRHQAKGVAMAAIKDMTGIRFGKLVVAYYFGADVSRKARWLCKCDCGKETVVTGSSLRSGGSKSCGCTRAETMKAVHTKHGMATRLNPAPEFGVWKDMIRRCTNKNRSDYKYYGGRGIAVCERWHEFANFFADMGERPHGMTIDRIDSNGNYEPSNCRWITIQEQQNNRRSCVFIEYQGRTQNMKQWAREFGVSYCTMRRKVKSGICMADIVEAVC